MPSPKADLLSRILAQDLLIQPPTTPGVIAIAPNPLTDYVSFLGGCLPALELKEGKQCLVVQSPSGTGVIGSCLLGQVLPFILRAGHTYQVDIEAGSQTTDGLQLCTMTASGVKIRAITGIKAWGERVTTSIQFTPVENAEQKEEGASLGFFCETTGVGQKLTVAKFDIKECTNP